MITSTTTSSLTFVFFKNQQNNTLNSLLRLKDKILKTFNYLLYGDLTNHELKVVELLDQAFSGNQLTVEQKKIILDLLKTKASDLKFNSHLTYYLRYQNPNSKGALFFKEYSYRSSILKKMELSEALMQKISDAFHSYKANEELKEKLTLHEFKWVYQTGMLYDLKIDLENCIDKESFDLTLGLECKELKESIWEGVRLNDRCFYSYREDWFKAMGHKYSLLELFVLPFLALFKSSYYLHSGMVHLNKETNNVYENHIRFQNHSLNQMCDQVFVSSEFVQIEANKLLTDQGFDALSKKWGANKEVVIEKLDIVLNERFSSLHCKDFNNINSSIQRAASCVFGSRDINREYTTEELDLDQPRKVFCTEYVALVLYKVIKELNEEFYLELGVKPLKQPMKNMNVNKFTPKQFAKEVLVLYGTILSPSIGLDRLIKYPIDNN
jgi:hypothetical protein